MNADKSEIKSINAKNTNETRRMQGKRYLEDMVVTGVSARRSFIFRIHPSPASA
jgi:hypothetical protein